MEENAGTENGERERERENRRDKVRRGQKGTHQPKHT